MTELKAMLNLFKMIDRVNYDTGDVTLKQMIANGFVIVDSNGRIAPSVSKSLADIIIDELGLGKFTWDNSLHKSWEKVENASIEELLADQLMHYMGTFLLNTLIVPAEEVCTNLGIPAAEAVTVIRAVTEDEKTQIINHYFEITSSPRKSDIQYIKKFVPYITDLNKVKSFEVKAMYWGLTGYVPKSAQDFLRLAIYRASDSTLVIKNRKTIDALSSFAYTNCAEKMFEEADLVELSKNFNRFKPLFLAFKSNEDLRPVINKISRLSKTHHVPMSQDTVQNLINLVAQDKSVSSIIDSMSIRELIKVVNYTRTAKNNLKGGDISIYKIRNGRVFVREDAPARNVYTLAKLDMLCTEALVNKLHARFLGKTFYIPKGIHYAAPVSEKQMVGNIPYGTRIDLPEDAFCIGIHWYNTATERVDLDLQCSTPTRDFGWNAGYRGSSVFFSGDMTDAPRPKGAVEAFRIVNNIGEPVIFSVHNYTATEGVDCKIIFTDSDAESNFGKNSTAIIDTKYAIMSPIATTISKDSETLGVYNNNSFYVYGGSLGDHIIPDRDMNRKMMEGLIDSLQYLMPLNKIIELGGGTIINERDEDVEYIDLSPQFINRTTLFDLIAD